MHKMNRHYYCREVGLSAIIGIKTVQTTWKNQDAKIQRNCFITLTLLVFIMDT